MGVHKAVPDQDSVEKPEPVRVDDFTVTRDVVKPAKDGAGLCLYYAALNCLDAECRRRFCANAADIEHHFREVGASRGHDSSTGYDAGDMNTYLQWLQLEGFISGYTWKRMYVRHQVLVELIDDSDGRRKKKDQVLTVDPHGMSIKDIVTARGFHVGDRLVLFGAAPTSEMKDSIPKAISAAVTKLGSSSRAKMKMSSNQIVAAQVRALNQKVSTLSQKQKEVREKCPGHAISVWFMSPSEVSGLVDNRKASNSEDSPEVVDAGHEDSAESSFGERKRPVPVLFDSGKKVVQVLTAKTWASSLTGVVRAYRFSVTP